MDKILFFIGINYVRRGIAIATPGDSYAGMIRIRSKGMISALRAPLLNLTAR